MPRVSLPTGRQKISKLAAEQQQTAFGARTETQPGRRVRECRELGPMWAVKTFKEVNLKWRKSKS